jgi:quercetin dioxygenase-like cupin family protein
MQNQGEPFKVISHHFIGGVYCKEIEIPENHIVTSHKHVFDHMSVLTSGCVIVDTGKEETETYFCPAIIEIKAGVNHSVTAVNGPAHWLCIHATGETDIEKIDESLIENAAQSINKIVSTKLPSMVKADFTIDVHQLVNEIHENPDLWNQHTLRTKDYGSPHREVSDIWLRYNSQKNFDPLNPENFSDKHTSVWYPAVVKLPAFEKVFNDLLDQLYQRRIGIELGGVLITKIPPGKQVYPHSDAGRWHSEHYDTKVLILLESAPGQTFNYANESYEGVAGEVFFFNNAPEHWVINNSDVDRVSLILATKRKP